MTDFEVIATGLKFPEGPIAMPDDAQYILTNCTGIQGFYGASSMERLPVETALRDQTEAFVNLTF